MTKPLTNQIELYARRLAEGASQSAAYREAYPRSVNWKPDSVHSKASTLAADVRVRERVEELRKEFAPASKLTLEAHIAELARLKEMALNAGKFDAAITAEVNRGKASGLYVTRTEDVTPPLQKALSRMTPERADKVISGLEEVRAIRERAKSA